MIKVRIKLTPLGHYFLGGERGFQFKYDENNFKRQMSESFFISSLKVPTQTTLFGALRYIIGVKNEKLADNAFELIGDRSYDISSEEDNFGIIKAISPLYLYKEKKSSAGKTEDDMEGYYIRTPFDHKITEDSSAESGEQLYTPFTFDGETTVEVINFPGKTGISKNYPVDYRAKDGISKSYLNVISRRIVSEDKIFKSAVEVVSRKQKDKNTEGFAKKQYFRLQPGWSFAFFADLDTDRLNDYNNTIVLGKGSSVFAVDIMEDKEPDIRGLFKERKTDFHYFQSSAYIKGNISSTIDKSSFSILENESMRKFETRNSRLRPVYEADLIQLISAGSVIYTDDISELTNKHAEIAGFNRIIEGGNR